MILSPRHTIYKDYVFKKKKRFNSYILAFFDALLMCTFCTGTEGPILINTSVPSGNIDTPGCPHTPYRVWGAFSAMFWAILTTTPCNFHVGLLNMARLNIVLDFFGEHLKFLCRRLFARLSTGKEIVTLSFSHEVKDASRGTKLRISPINFEVLISHENGH